MIFNLNCSRQVLLGLFLLATPTLLTAQNSTLQVNATTGAIIAPINAATFAAVNGLGGGGGAATNIVGGASIAAIVAGSTNIINVTANPQFNASQLTSVGYPGVAWSTISRPCRFYNSWPDLGGVCPGTNLSATYITNVIKTWKTNGMLAAGYNLIWLDSGWGSGTRNASGQLNPSTMFPDMAGLVKYAHTNGFIFGLYVSCNPLGTSDCSFLEGFTSEPNVQADATEFSTWGIDALKIDYQSTTNELIRDRMWNTALLGGSTNFNVQNKRPIILVTDAEYSQGQLFGPYTEIPVVASYVNILQNAQGNIDNSVYNTYINWTNALTRCWVTKPGVDIEMTPVVTKAWGTGTTGTNTLKSNLIFSALLSSDIQVCDINPAPNQLLYITNTDFLTIDSDPLWIPATNVITIGVGCYAAIKPLERYPNGNRYALGLINISASNTVAFIIHATNFGWPIGTPMTFKDVFDVHTVNGSPITNNATFPDPFICTVDSSNSALFIIEKATITGYNPSFTNAFYLEGTLEVKPTNYQSPGIFTVQSYSPAAVHISGDITPGLDNWSFGYNNGGNYTYIKGKGGIGFYGVGTNNVTGNLLGWMFIDGGMTWGTITGAPGTSPGSNNLLIQGGITTTAITNTSLSASQLIGTDLNKGQVSVPYFSTTITNWGTNGVLEGSIVVRTNGVIGSVPFPTGGSSGGTSTFNNNQFFANAGGTNLATNQTFAIETTTTGLIASGTNNITNNLPTATATTKGAVLPDGNVTHYYDGTGAWSTPPGGSAPTAGTNISVVGSTVSVSQNVLTNQDANPREFVNTVKVAGLTNSGIEYLTNINTSASLAIGTNKAGVGSQGASDITFYDGSGSAFGGNTNGQTWFMTISNKPSLVVSASTAAIGTAGVVAGFSNANNTVAIMNVLSNSVSMPLGGTVSGLIIPGVAVAWNTLNELGARGGSGTITTSGLFAQNVAKNTNGILTNYTTAGTFTNQSTKHITNVGAVTFATYYTNSWGGGNMQVTIVPTSTITVGALVAAYVFSSTGVADPGFFSTGASVGLATTTTNTISFSLGYQEYFAITNLGNGSPTIVTNWLKY